MIEEIEKSGGTQLDTSACLYVIRGEPFRSGTCLNLSSPETWVGRAADGDSPDVAFTNAFISRKHFVIRIVSGKAVLYDLGSRHGTEINGIPVVPHKPYPLQSMDIIKLAKGMTVIHFSYLFAEQTLEFEPITSTQQMEAAKIPLILDWEKRECTVDGRRIGMSEKEYLLLKLLFEHANRLVLIPEIKLAVWPERVTEPGSLPDVHMDELNALIYRIRKKFGANTFVLNAVRGSGYALRPIPNLISSGRLTMRYVQVEQTGALQGAVHIPGSKNSSLALLAAACLADDIVTLEGIPDIQDVKVIEHIGRDIGLSMHRLVGGALKIDPRGLHTATVDPGKASSYRASYYFAGALLAKFGRVMIGFPGGDNFTSRPIDQHVKVFQALGATVTFHENYYEVEAAELRGADIYFDTITSGATINALLVAVRAKGRTTLYNAAVDPEVVDTAALLIELGARIYGAGTDCIRIEGVPYLTGGTHTVIPDRLIAGAFLMAAGVTGGQVTVKDVIPEHLGACIAKLKEVGLGIETGDQHITAYGTGRLKATRIRAMMYPGFATDLQQPMTALLTLAMGKSIVTEKVFPNRFNHVPQLRRLGAEIELRKASAFITGGRPLLGGWVHATDVRAGTCLVLAGMAAEGRTCITGVEHLERGYDDLIGSFQSLGAKLILIDQGQEAESDINVDWQQQLG